MGGRINTSVLTAWVSTSTTTLSLSLSETDVNQKDKTRHVESSLHLKACRDGMSTTLGGKAFQLSTTLNEKKLCCRLEQHLNFFSLYLCPLVVVAMSNTNRLLSSCCCCNVQYK